MKRDDYRASDWRKVEKVNKKYMVLTAGVVTKVVLPVPIGQRS